jgi:hypothetical protein
MRLKLVILAATCMALSGCATLANGFNSAGQSLCANRDQVALGYTSVILNAPLITNEVIRNTVVAAAQSGLDALQSCPPETP